MASGAGRKHARTSPQGTLSQEAPGGPWTALVPPFAPPWHPLGTPPGAVSQVAAKARPDTRDCHPTRSSDQNFLIGLFQGVLPRESWSSTRRTCRGTDLNRRTLRPDFRGLAARIASLARPCPALPSLAAPSCSGVSRVPRFQGSTIPGDLRSSATAPRRGQGRARGGKGAARGRSKSARNLLEILRKIASFRPEVATGVPQIIRVRKRGLRPRPRQREAQSVVFKKWNGG